MPTAIQSIKAREILDSRRNPTIKVDVQLDRGALGRSAFVLSPSALPHGN